MKRQGVLTVCLCLMLSVILSGAAFSQERRILRIQGFFGGALPIEQTIGAGLWSNFGFSLPVQKKLALSFDFGHWASEVTGSPEAFLNGTVYVNPFFGSLQYLMMPDSTFTPYVFLGAGFVFGSFRLGDVIAIPEISLSQKLKNGPAGKIGIGLETDITNSFSLVGEVFFFLMTTEGTTTVQDMNFGVSVESFRVNLSSLILHVGFRYATR